MTKKSALIHMIYPRPLPYRYLDPVPDEDGPMATRPPKAGTCPRCLEPLHEDREFCELCRDFRFDPDCEAP